MFLFFVSVLKIFGAQQIRPDSSSLPLYGYPLYCALPLYGYPLIIILCSFAPYGYPMYCALRLFLNYYSLLFRSTAIPCTVLYRSTAIPCTVLYKLHNFKQTDQRKKSKSTPKFR